MRDPVAATYRGTGAATAEVGLHPKAGEGGRLFDTVTTLVQLHRYSNGWVPTGAKAVDSIEVAQPLPFARILSPLTVSGLSVAYEGTVHVTVTQDRRGADRVLGKGFVNGGGAELAPFKGQITFATPTPGVDAGWVVFSGDTGAGSGIIEATAVRVRFVNSDHKPQILDVVTTPPAVRLGQARHPHRVGDALASRLEAFGAERGPRPAGAERHRRPAPRQAAGGRHDHQRRRRALVDLLALPGRVLPPATCSSR